MSRPLNYKAPSRERGKPIGVQGRSREIGLSKVSQETAGIKSHDVRARDTLLAGKMLPAMSGPSLLASRQARSPTSAISVIGSSSAVVHPIACLDPQTPDPSGASWHFLHLYVGATEPSQDSGLARGSVKRTNGLLVRRSVSSKTRGRPRTQMGWVGGLAQMREQARCTLQS